VTAFSRCGNDLSRRLVFPQPVQPCRPNSEWTLQTAAKLDLTSFWEGLQKDEPEKADPP